ncbi:MAG: flagellar hook-associated protein FlgL [Betaproteobacteria bacterium]|nr:flagellar hook-associated protein FlgL [Betaproteobacteria bacterium]
MRISTSMIYDMGVAGMQHNRGNQVKLQEQLASGQRMLTPADDPVAAASALDVRQAQGLNAQLKINGDNARSQLGLEENALADATSLLQDVKTLAVYAGNPTLSNSDRASIATELKSRYQELLGIANRGDGNGQFLFSGYQGGTQPFSQTGPGSVSYAGDAGQRLIQIGTTRTIPINDSGDAIFRAIKNGNGTFATAAGTAFAGGATIDAGIVTDPAKWNAAANAKDFTIRFDVNNGVTPPVTTYDIVDNVNNVSLLTGAAPAAGPHLRTYVAGAAISLATQSPPDTNPTPFDFGATVAVSGAPASGDTFTIQASTNQDIFSTLQGLIAALDTGTNGSPAATGVYRNALNSAMACLDNAFNNVLEVRADVGARLKEVDAAQGTTEDLALQYGKTLSGLQDLDYTKAISDLNLQQVYLQAAQQAFLKTTSLNLFDILR